MSGDSKSPGPPVPAPRPRSETMTKRTLEEINSVAGLYDGNVLQTNYSRRSQKDTIAWMTTVTTGIDPKFSLLKTESVEEEQLEAVYDLGMRVKALAHAMKTRGLQSVFDLTHCINEDLIGASGFTPTFEEFGNLLDVYSQVSLETVRKCVRYTMEYGEDHMAWGQTLTYQLVERSCEPELRARVNEYMLSIPPEEQGGPTYFKIAMDCITSSSYNISLALINKIDHMKIRNYEGENVLTVVSFLRGACNRLKMCDDLPKNIEHKILAIMRTSSNRQFSEFFSNWYTQLSLQSTGPVKIDKLVTIEDILQQATRQYNILLEESRWIVTKKKGANFKASNQNNNKDPLPAAQNVSDDNKIKGSGLQRNGNENNKNKQGQNSKKNDNGENDGKRTPKWSIPPGPGEPTERMWKNKTEYWCAKCKRWRRHSTAEHVDNHCNNNNNADGRTVTFADSATTAHQPQGVLRRTGL